MRQLLRHGVAAARHQLAVGRGSSQPGLRGQRGRGACASSCALRGQVAGRAAEQRRQDAGGRRAGGSLDLLTPDGCRSVAGRCGQAGRSCRFRTSTRGEAALVFWLPAGHSRIKMHAATDA